MSSESNYSLTTKVDGDLFTVRGDTAEEFQNNLRAVVTNDLVSYVLAVQEAARGNKAQAAVHQTFPGATPVADTRSFEQIVSEPAQASTFSGAAAAAGAPTCAHGARSWKSGTSKNGKPYNGWFCTSNDRDNQCPPQWSK